MADNLTALVQKISVVLDKYQQAEATRKCVRNSRRAFDKVRKVHLMKTDCFDNKATLGLAILVKMELFLFDRASSYSGWQNLEIREMINQFNRMEYDWFSEDLGDYVPELANGGNSDIEFLKNLVAETRGFRNAA